ncbi:MAG: GntR family transcriptional regulator [Negativicutes bacterium]|nr:GntR family transcriptional regulator [Negativicutes bacterium]
MEIGWIERLRQESSREYIFRLLKTNILNLKLPPGSSISENEISDMLNVSRTPVREAFIKLAEATLLTIQPQRGTYISLIDPDQVEEAEFHRECLEKEVIKLACVSFPIEDIYRLWANIEMQRLCIQEKNYLKLFELDEQMHGMIFGGCRKARIWSAIQQMNTHYNRVRMLNSTVTYDWPSLIEQHQQIVQAIQSKDVELGSSAVQVHLNKLIIGLSDLQRDFSHYFKQPQQVTVNMKAKA